MHLFKCQELISTIYLNYRNIKSYEYNLFVIAFRVLFGILFLNNYVSSCIVLLSVTAASLFVHDKITNPTRPLLRIQSTSSDDDSDKNDVILIHE